jgi:HlyD family secretion protein
MKRLRLLVLVVVLALAGAAVVLGVPDLSAPQDQMPTTKPTRGDLDVKVHTLGDLRALRASALTAPTTGGTLQIVTLSPAGAIVKKDDVVLAFDLEEQHYNLAQSSSELAEAEQEIIKLKADARVQAAQDQVALLQARYALRRAELEVTGNEFVGAIDARKNLLALEEAKRNLAQLNDDVKTHAASSQAALAVLEEKRRKAHLAKQFAEKNIENMTVRAPIDGLVVVKENRDASGGFFTPGMTLPEYREGDAVQPGRIVAEVVDISELEIKAKVNETDRPALGTGAIAAVRVEALPAENLSGTAKGVGGLASRNFWEVSSSRQFDAAFKIDRAVQTLRPGMTAEVVVQGEKLKNVLHLPRQVLFEKSGKPIVYVKNGDGFKPVEVKVQRVTETRVVLEGFDESSEVALANPDLARRPGSQASTSPLPGGGP